MRSIIKYLILLIIMVMFSCEKEPVFVNCQDCNKDEPATILLRISVDKYALNNIGTTTIRIYSGNIEENILLMTATSDGTDMTYTASINKKYTVSATYITSNATYVAVDSATPRVKYETGQCEEPCYYVYDYKLDLRIKYGLN